MRLPVGLTRNLQILIKMVYRHKKTGLLYTPIDEEVNKNDVFKPTVVSLFSGAGGFDIGLEQAGFQTITCIENDVNCRATLKYNRPDWGVFEGSTLKKNVSQSDRQVGDIRSIDTDEVLEFTGKRKGEITLLVGGAPCQPFSNIGKKLGEKDERNGDLFLEFVRFVKGIEPQAFIFENVAGITQSKHSAVLDYMFNQFNGSGYGLSYSLVNAANYGVPQRRERFILIGIKDVKTPAFPLPTHAKNDIVWKQFVDNLETNNKLKVKSWKTIRQTFEKLPRSYTTRNDYAVMNISEMVQHRMEYIKQGQNFKALPMDMRPQCWKSGKHQGNDTFGRLVADFPSVTIRTAAYNPAKGMYIHPFENRGLNTIEMASLQDFPYDWEFKTLGRERVTLVSSGKQIGNAVPPGLAKALGLSVKKQIGVTAEFFQIQGQLDLTY
jgi:DNA (cytosine-5)-methyltransferase 1